MLVKELKVDSVYYHHGTIPCMYRGTKVVKHEPCSPPMNCCGGKQRYHVFVTDDGTLYCERDEINKHFYSEKTKL